MTEDELLENFKKDDEEYQKMKEHYWSMFPHRDFSEQDEKYR